MVNATQARVLRFLTAALIALLACGSASAATVVRPPSGARVIDGNYFGMHIRWGATTPYWPQARFGSWRVITGETTWYGLEKDKGDWHFDALDRAVAVAELHGVEILHTLGYPPKWAVSARFKDAWNPGIALPPEDMQAWEDYVRRVVTRYMGRVKYYELMNEPHFTEVDAPGSKVDFPVAVMVDMARIASRVIKQTDPAAKLVSMSPSGMSTGVRRIQSFLAAGGGKYIDIVGFHFYDSRGPEHVPELVSALQKVLAANGQATLEIWNTESGFYIDGPDKPTRTWQPPENFALYSPDQGAGIVSRALTLGAAAGLRRFYWYSWDIPTLALTDGRGKVIAPAGRAYIKTERWLNGATISECRSSDDKLWVCSLSRGSRQAWLVWNTKGTLDWRVPAQWPVRQYETLLGGPAAVVSGEHVEVGELPILFVSDEESWGTP